MPDTLNFHDLVHLAPEIVLAVWGLVVLTVDFSMLRRVSAARRQQVLGSLTVVGVLGALAAVFLPGASLFLPNYVEAGGVEDPSLFFGTIAGDNLTLWMNLLLVVLLALVVRMSMAWSFTEHWGEYFALLCWATVGMMLLIAAEELLILFLSLEMMTICLYLCAAFEKGKRRSAEGGLKYFVYGSVSSALFLFGLSLIYGMAGSTRFDAIEAALSPNLLDLALHHEGAGASRAVGLAGNVAGATAVLLILVGFGFKIAAFPFHQWAPDAYEGAPAPVTAWIASGSKLASFIAMMKVLLHALGPWATRADSATGPGWVVIVGVIAAATMTFGNLAALAQRNFKRMLAYSSIAHAGYMLVGVLAVSISSQHQQAAGAVLFYLVIYTFTTVGAFAVAAWMAKDLKTDDIEDLNGLGKHSPILAVCIILLMLSLIGMPPLAGFFGKMYMFMEALNVTGRTRAIFVWLVALGLLNSVISAFYYVRVLKAMFLRDRDPSRPGLGPAPSAVVMPVAVSTLVVIVCGVFPDTLLNLMRETALPMLTSNNPTLAGTFDPAPAGVKIKAQPRITPAVKERNQMTPPQAKKP